MGLFTLKKKKLPPPNHARILVFMDNKNQCMAIFDTNLQCFTRTSFTRFYFFRVALAELGVAFVGADLDVEGVAGAGAFDGPALSISFFAGGAVAFRDFVGFSAAGDGCGATGAFLGFSV